MPVQLYRPTSPGRRGATGASFDEITVDKPYKPLTERLFKHAGRNNQGKITVRHRGGGHKRLYRIVDFRRDKHGIVAKVAAIHYDPHRNARLSDGLVTEGCLRCPYHGWEFDAEGAVAHVPAVQVRVQTAAGEPTQADTGRHRRTEPRHHPSAGTRTAAREWYEPRTRGVD